LLENQIFVDIFYNIFQFLDQETLCRCSLLSSQLYPIAYDERIWKIKFLNTWKIKNSVNCSIDDPPVHPLTWRESCKNFHLIMKGKDIKFNNMNVFLLKMIGVITTDDFHVNLHKNNFPYVQFDKNVKLALLNYPTVFINYEKYATPILYCFDHVNHKWFWTPDLINFMESNTTTVSCGVWSGDRPVSGNIRTIEALEKLKPQFRNYYHCANNYVISLSNRLITFTFQNYFLIDQSKMPNLIYIFACQTLQNQQLKKTWDKLFGDSEVD